MADGWENARRRGPGNDYVVVRLGLPGQIDHAEIDTSCFIGNAPGWVRLSATEATGEDGEWRELLPRTRMQPDTRHRFRIGSETEAAQVRLDVYPDGGIGRLRLLGTVSAPALAALERRWAAR
jgi:allantoicase